jgi:NADPH-ferrihemoprotein reductase
MTPNPRQHASTTPQVIDDLFKLLTPTDIADYVAPTILSLAGATYLLRGILWDQPDLYYLLPYL